MNIFYNARGSSWAENAQYSKTYVRIWLQATDYTDYGVNVGFRVIKLK